MSFNLKVGLHDHELVRILKLNMRPGFHLYLGHELRYLDTLNELIQRCVELEDMWTKYGYFPEANLNSSKSVHELVSDQSSITTQNSEVFAFNSHTQGYKPPVPKYSDIGDSKVKAVPTVSSNITCFNCQQRGHYANACPHPKKSPENEDLHFICPKCHFTGNVNRESRTNVSSPLRPNQVSEMLHPTEMISSNPIQYNPNPPQQ